MPIFGPPNIEKMKERDDIRGLLKVLRKNYEDYIHVQAVYALTERLDAYSTAPRDDIQSAGKPPLETLHRFLKHEKSDMRQNSAYLLGEIGDESSIDPLIELIRNEKEKKYIKARAAKALGRIGNKRAVEPLLELIPDGYPDMNKSVLRALGEIADVSIIEPLILGKPDLHKYNIDEICDAISNIGKDALPILEKINSVEHENYMVNVLANGSIKRINENLS